MIYKTEAIVLGAIELIGAHKIISFYSPDYGRIRGVAHGVRGIKNPFGSALEPLTHVNVIYRFNRNRELQTIKQADILDHFKQIRQNITSLAAGLYVGELVQKLTPVEGVGQPELFHLILKALRLISGKVDIHSVLRIFETRFLTILGYRPYTEKCLSCSAGRYGYRWGFSPSMGGIICPACSYRFKDFILLSPGGAMFLRQALVLDLERAGRLRVMPSSREELECILHTMLSRYLTAPLKSYPVLQRLLKPVDNIGIKNP